MTTLTEPTHTRTFVHRYRQRKSQTVPRGQSDESDRSSILDSLAPGFLLSWRRSDDSTTAELTGTGRNCEIGDGDHQRRTRDGSPWRILLTSHTGRTSHLALQWRQYPVWPCHQSPLSPGTHTSTKRTKGPKLYNPNCQNLVWSYQGYPGPNNNRVQRTAGGQVSATTRAIRQGSPNPRTHKAVRGRPTKYVHVTGLAWCRRHPGHQRSTTSAHPSRSMPTTA